MLKGDAKKKFQNTFDYSNIYTRIFALHSHFKLSNETL